MWVIWWDKADTATAVKTHSAQQELSRSDTGHIALTSQLACSDAPLELSVARTGIGFVGRVAEQANEKAHRPAIADPLERVLNGLS
jgi:hypothetical protein